MNLSNVPSEEDFARARGAMKARDQGLSEVRARILERFRDEGLHEAFVLYSPANQFFVPHLFYQRDNQISTGEESGLTNRIKSAVVEELERVGRGDRASIRVEFEFDSHENIEANFEGDYFLRLR